MDFEEENVLHLNETKNNLSDVSFVSSDCVDQHLNKLNQLLTTIKQNKWGCDFILCLFLSALNTYKADQCLRPFPPQFISEDDKDINRLRNVCDRIPSLNNIITQPCKCPESVIDLLIWLFLDKFYPTLKRMNFNNIPFPSQIDKAFRPHFIYEVCYSEKFETAWNKRKFGKGTFFAYHGSPIHNFYSILKVGLQHHFSIEKEGIFGNGIYLSNEISVSAIYAPFGQSWANSVLGSKHSVIGLCEVINDVHRVKCRDPANTNRSFNSNSVGEIPEKYFVVTNSDMVRVKYLLIYRQTHVSTVKSYLMQNMFVTVIVVYFIFLIMIGVFSNSMYVRSLKQLWSHVFC